MIESKQSQLPVARQLTLLGVPKSSYYYQAHRKIERVYWDEVIKEEIMELYMNYPFYGIPRVTAQLTRMGYTVNHKRVRRLRGELGLKTVYPRRKFRTSEPCKTDEKYPYLLDNLVILRPNQVWATDITYTAVKGGRAFVIAIIDLFSRKVLSYNVVNTMDAEHCVEALNMALRRYGKPEIFNSDQGSQFTGNAFINTLKEHKIRISMDGKGRCLDNAKMERFWWALKYENIYLSDYGTIAQLCRGVQSYVNFYNSRRIHSALDWKTPDEAYGQYCNVQPMSYSKSESLHLSFS